MADKLFVSKLVEMVAPQQRFGLRGQCCVMRAKSAVCLGPQELHISSNIAC